MFESCLFYPFISNQSHSHANFTSEISLKYIFFFLSSPLFFIPVHCAPKIIVKFLLKREVERERNWFDNVFLSSFKNQLALICFHDVLVYSCYCNKIPQSMWLISNRKLFLTVGKTRQSKIRAAHSTAAFSGKGTQPHSLPVPSRCLHVVEGVSKLSSLLFRGH